MSAFADMSLKDKDAVERVFAASGRDANSIFNWRTAYVTSSWKLQAYITAAYRALNANSTAAKSTIKFVFPVVANGVKDGDIVLNLSAVVPLTATDTDKNNALAFFSDAIATEAQIRDLIKGGVVV